MNEISADLTYEDSGDDSASEIFETGPVQVVTSTIPDNNVMDLDWTANNVIEFPCSNTSKLNLSPCKATCPGMSRPYKNIKHPSLLSPLPPVYLKAYR